MNSVARPRAAALLGRQIVVVFVGARLDIEPQLGGIVVFGWERFCHHFVNRAVRCVVDFFLANLLGYADLYVTEARLNFCGISTIDDAGSDSWRMAVDRKERN